MDQDEKIRRAAIRACKSYGWQYKFRCPVCKEMAAAEKSVNGFIMISGCGCGRTLGFRI